MKLGQYTIMLTATVLLAVSAQAATLLFVPASGDINDTNSWYDAGAASFVAPTATDNLDMQNIDAGQGNQTLNVNVDTTVQTLYNDWNSQGYTNTVTGPGTLTVTAENAWWPGIAVRAGGAGARLNIEGKVAVNSPYGVADIRTQNSAANVIEFTPASTLTLTTTAATLEWGGGGDIRFNGTINGGADLMIQSAGVGVSFNAGHDSSAHTGNILLNGGGNNLTINGGVVGNSGNQLISNYGANSIIINSANAINGAGVSAWGALTLDLNAGQDDFGAINEIQAAGLTIDITGLGAGEEVWFDDSTGGAWGGALTVIGYEPGVIRFGTDASGLTGEQLGLINEGYWSLDSQGYLVPEPATMGLLLIGGLGLFAARRARV